MKCVQKKEKHTMNKNPVYSFNPETIELLLFFIDISIIGNSFT